MFGFSNEGRFLTDQRRRNRSSRNHERIDRLFLHYFTQLGDEVPSLIQRLQILHRQNSCSRLKSRANVLAILRRATGKPSGLLMIMTGLCPGDAIAGPFGLCHKRYGNLLPFCTQSANSPNCSIKTLLYFTGKHVEEKFPWYPQPKLAQFF